MKPIRQYLRPISLLKFSLLLSLANMVMFNIPFFGYVMENATTDALPKAVLMVSLVLLMLVLNFMVSYFLMFTLRIVGRVLLALCTVISALAEYFVLTYNILIDEITIGNVFNTRYSEASGFFGWQLFAFVAVLGVLPAIYIMLQPVVYGKKKSMGKWCGSSLGAILLLVAINFNQILWVGNNDTELGGLLMPWSYTVNSIRVMNIRHDKQAEEIKLPDATIADNEKTVVVLVIGESARKANFQLYGYKRQTNPLLSKQADLHVLPAQSCGTYTTAGTKAILEPMDSGDLYEILPNYAFRTGVDVSWRSYNWGEPPVHIDEYLTDTDLAELYPEADRDYDEILFTGLKERILQSKKNKVLIILHTSTSHGPDYTEKYPKRFEHFKPVIDNVEKAQKELNKLVNAYDNSILYTDHLLSNLIDTLRTMTDRKTAMIYISDHGESLGEKNLFMHGVPMSMAPKEQYEIPFLVWLSPGFRTIKPFSEDGKAADDKLPTPLDQHYIFHSVLDLLSIKSPAYKPEMDIFTNGKLKMENGE